MDEPRQRFAAMVCGLDIHYELDGGHPLVGRRMPDLDLGAGGGPLRVFSLLHHVRPVLLAVPAPNAVLIRPDGYVAWVGDLTLAGLTDALTNWFGPPAEA